MKVLISEKRIHRRIKELAALLAKENAHYVVVLKGAMVFFTYLMRELRRKGAEVNFSVVKLSSYHGTKTSGNVVLELDVKEDIRGKNVIIIEDIVDTGLTVDFLKKRLMKKGAKGVKVCTLLDKKERRKVQCTPDVVGFDIPDKFVVGFGLDYRQKYRDLPYVGVK